MKFLHYQLDDLARASLVDGLILAWDKGMGKTLAAFAWPMLKGAKRTLLVVPGALHRQTIAEAKDKFGVTVRRWESGKVEKCSGRPAAAGPDLSPSHLSPSHLPTFSLPTFSLATYQEVVRADPAALDAFDCVVIDEGTRLKASDSLTSLAIRRLRPRFRLVLTGTPVKNRLEDIFWLAQWAAAAQAPPECESAKVKGVKVSGSPAAAAGPDLSPSHLRTFPPSHLLTFSPFPYPPTEEGRAAFARDHMATERDAAACGGFYGGQETAAGCRRPASATNLPRLWRTLAPVMLRRTKDETGTSIVPRTVRLVRVPMGRAQALCYSLAGGGACGPSLAGGAAGGTPFAALSILRAVAACPKRAGLPLSSWTALTPKMFAILELIARLTAAGEQVVIMSPFRHFSDALSQRLDFAGVPHWLLDGRTSQAERGALAAAFKRREFPLLLAGLDSMAEGHSFSQCAHLVIASLAWAMDQNEQAIDRVHRLDSPRPVTIHIFTTAGTIEERLEEMFIEKQRAASAAITDAAAMEFQRETLDLPADERALEDAGRSVQFSVVQCSAKAARCLLNTEN